MTQFLRALAIVASIFLSALLICTVFLDSLLRQARRDTCQAQGMKDDDDCLLNTQPLDKHNIKDWFGSELAHPACTPQTLFACSGWGPNRELFERRVLKPISFLNPPLKDGDSVYEMGAGAGGGLQLLDRKYRNLTLAGSDFVPEIVGYGQKALPDVKMFVHDMTKRHEQFADNSFDHVFSFGALAMYLTKPQMLFALAEAIRLTKPGGSCVFSHFIPPGKRPRASIIQPVRKQFWHEDAERLGIEDVATETFWRERYVLAFRKKSGSKD